MQLARTFYFIIFNVLIFGNLSHGKEITTLEWIDLIPEEYREQQLQTQALYDLEDLPDVLSSQQDLPAQIDEQSFDPDTLQPKFSPVVKSLDKKMIRIPGYAVPIEMNKVGDVIEFLLVPYFGACIHVPPPPANQIIHVIYKKGLKINALEDAVWVEGKLRVTNSDTEWADANYKMSAKKVALYR